MMNFYPYWNLIHPILPTNNIEPPTLFSILQSIVNFGKDDSDKVKVTELAKNGRATIFNFEYPLSEKIDKEKFEISILNHFIMRRINFDTVLLFQMQLENKLNEIMPFYNQMFDSIDGWDLFADEIHNLESTTTTNDTSTTTSENTLNATDDIRNSNMPQAQIDNVKSGSYLTNYSYNSTDNTSNGTTSGESNGTNTNILSETRNRTPGEKIEIYKAFQNDIKNIYTLLYKDLEPLFYQIINN